MKRLLLLFSILNIQYSIFNISFSQDIHFSQFYNIPLVVNPAMTGAFNGDQRAALNYKDQWNIKDANTGSSHATYRTFAFSLDAGLFKKKWDKAYLGAGLLVFKDVAGTSKLATTQVSLSVSSFVSLGENQKVSVGLQGGLQQKSMDVSAQTWDNQYCISCPSGVNVAISSNENIASASNVNFGDYTAGLQWTYSNASATLSSNDRKSFNAGVAFHHVNQPKQQFNDVAAIAAEADKLHSRIAAHAGAFIGIKNFHLAVVPSLLYMKQGSAQEINVGTLLRYAIKEESKYTGIFKETAVSVGGYFRARDAFIPAVMLEYASLAIGLTYDVNTSYFRTVTTGKGGFELSLRYINPNPFGGGTTKSVRFL